ncbi:MAG: metallophosphatase domain-containing protein [Saprospiraceae bacterium]
MNLTLISDTHGFHDGLDLSSGEVLLHTGDVSSRGSLQEVESFLNWFARQNFEHKIFIAGNHDFFFESANADAIQQLIPEGVTYLNDSGITINDVHFWGSPVQPRFFDWAFNKDRGADIDQHWQLIPDDVDVLLTHGPPHGILDRTVGDQEVGCEMLRKKIREIKPQLSVFGHIHEGYGMRELEETTFVNASVLDHRYRLVNDPVILEL